MLLETISHEYVNSRWIAQVAVKPTVDKRFNVCVRMKGETAYHALVVADTEKMAHYFVRQLGVKVKALKVADED